MHIVAGSPEVVRQRHFNSVAVSGEKEEAVALSLVLMESKFVRSRAYRRAASTTNGQPGHIDEFRVLALLWFLIIPR